MDVLTVDHLAQVLQESNVHLLTQVLRMLGQDRCRALLEDTLQCEANGGMLRRDGTHRRTPGGVFFHLVKERMTTHEHRRLFPRPAPQRHRAPALSQGQPQAPTWDEVRAIVDTLPQGGLNLGSLLRGAV